MVSLGIYCEKIPTISLINIHHHTATLLFCHEHFTDLLSVDLNEGSCTDVFRNTRHGWASLTRQAIFPIENIAIPK